MPTCPGSTTAKRAPEPPSPAAISTTTQAASATATANFTNNGPREFVIAAHAYVSKKDCGRYRRVIIILMEMPTNDIVRE
jgi:hypothetical protein